MISLQTRAFFTILMVALVLVPVPSTAFWGYGMYGGMGICPGGMFPGMGADHKDDYVDFLRQEIKDLRSDLIDVRRRARYLTEKVDQYEEALASIGSLGDIAAQHMRTKRACIGGYVQVSKKSSKGNEGKQGVPDKSFSLWGKVCLSKGKVRADICASSPHPLCREAVAKYGMVSSKLERIADEEQAIKATIKDRKEDLRDARKEASQDTGLEAFCLPCMLMGNPMASGFGGVGMSGILPQIGNIQQMTQSTMGVDPRLAQANQQLGWGTPMSFGFPFGQNENYGSIPGAAGMGGFGCAPGIGGGPNALFGGLGPMGFPDSSGPRPLFPWQEQSGGMYPPGFTPIGIPGPGGIGGPGEFPWSSEPVPPNLGPVFNPGGSSGRGTLSPTPVPPGQQPFVR